MSDKLLLNGLIAMILLVLVSQLTPRQGSQANVISSDMDLASTRSHSRGLRNRRARVRQPEVRKSGKPSLLSQFKETVTAGNRNSIVLALEELAFTAEKSVDEVAIQQNRMRSVENFQLTFIHGYNTFRFYYENDPRYPGLTKEQYIGRFKSALDGLTSEGTERDL